MKQLLTFLFSTLFCLSIFAQTDAVKKELAAFRTSQKIKIDGSPDEPDWKNAAVATDFFWRWPNAGAVSKLKTEARILYDDDALYVSIHCFDNPDSVASPLNKRDNLQNSDWAGILIDTYRDGQNALEFDVMASNVQFDSKYSVANSNGDNGNADGEDPAWDGVWLSATTKTADGWVAEFEIPFATLRFPKTAVQSWGINILRRVNRLGQQDCWNRISPDQRSVPQCGVLSGLTNIKAPLRLSATPFLAQNFSNFHDKNASPASVWGRQFSAGLDLKYGLNEAFTLDATIIPDFAQVRSDNQVLNLSPFEVRFNENRPFFMEGTELFNKGGLFYSRRIGNRPLHYWDVYDDLGDSEIIDRSPSTVQLLNATKISGRTKGGTGIGIFNAIEGPTTATILDEETKKTREVQTSSLTDKNIFVVDQNLKNNGYITFINTLVLRSGGDYDADVSGLTFNLRDKKNAYSVSGNGYLSQRFFSENIGTASDPKTVDRGHTWSLNLDKTSGAWTWHVGVNEETENYNPNDLGFLYSPNEQSALTWVNYSVYKPKGNWNNWWSSVWFWAGRYYQPRVLNALEIGGNIGGNTKGFHNMGLNFSSAPWGEHDYFEPRTGDFSRYFALPGRARLSGWYNSDQRKNWQVFAGGQVSRRGKYGGRTGASPWGGFSVRIGKKFSTGMDINADFVKNDVGFALPEADASSVGYETLLDSTGSFDGQNIVFGQRNILGFDNGLRVTWTFNTKMNLTFRARHYWNRVKYNEFYLLNRGDGDLGPTAYTGRTQTGEKRHDITANYFNIDCIYTWRFAPGSDLIFVWKNAVYNEYSQATDGYFYNLRQVPGLPMQNDISLKVLYWLDYAALKK